MSSADFARARSQAFWRKYFAIWVYSYKEGLGIEVLLRIECFLGYVEFTIIAHTYDGLCWWDEREYTTKQNLFIFIHE